MAGTKKLDAQRVSQRMHLAKLLKNVDDVEEEAQLSTMASRIATISSKLEDIHKDIIDIITEADDDLLVKELSSNLDDAVLTDEASTKVQARLLKLHRPPGSTPGSPGSVTPSTDGVMPHGFLQQQKLPALTLPSFSGDPMHYRSFMDRFESAVSSRALPEVQKFTYLQAALKGEAKDALQGLSCTASNYQAAMGILKKRFGDPALLIPMYAMKLVKMDPAKEGDAESLRSLLDGFQSAYRELRTLVTETYASHVPEAESTTELTELLLSPILEGKLPQSVHLEYVRRTKDRFSVTKLLDFIEDEVVALRSLATIAKKPAPSHNQIPRSHPATSAFRIASRTAPSSQPTPYPCATCSSTSHVSPFQCPKIKGLSVPGLRSLVRERALCYNCLRPSHSVISCPSLKGCGQCGQKHHTLLHEAFPSGSAHPSSRPSSQVSAHKVATSSAPTPSCNSLLMTVTLNVTGCNRPVRALLDTGSDISYCSSQLADEVSAPSHETRALTIETFGGGISKEEKRPVVRLEIQSRTSNHSLRIQAVAMPFLCSPTGQIPLKVVRELPIGLADPPPPVGFGARPNDLLLGVDLFPHLLLPEPPRLHGNLLLTPSKYGLIVSGRVGAPSTASISSIARTLRVSALTDDVELFWMLEGLGLSEEPQLSYPPPKKLPSGRIEVELPFLDEERPSFSVDQARRRLPPSCVREEYQGILQEYLEKGILEEASPGCGNFLPHHGVKAKG
jgi:hypothetical protein